jgi:hypothetical protein
MQKTKKKKKVPLCEQMTGEYFPGKEKQKRISYNHHHSKYS